MADNVENIGKIFVVDPNPPGTEVIPLEDLFIYVNFTAYPRSRTTYNGTDKSGNSFLNFGVEDEVNFIATSIKYNEDGKLDPSLQKTYATTDWSNIGTFGETKSGGLLEGFGIKSISIKYSTSLVPEVDITFTDVRGTSLFDKLSDNSDIKSPYSIFFKLPYPIFRLSIKGYYGQKVDYCLHMMNWTSSFDNSTGNFDISAKFLGYQQAILNDMVLGNIIGTVNTDLGFQKLQSITTNPIKIDDFLVKLSKLQIDSEVIKSESESFEKLKKLNGKLSLLKQIQSFIGKPIRKSTLGQSNEGGESENYLSIPNDEIQIKTDGVTRSGSNLIKDTNYLSIRDYLLVKNTNRRDVKNFVVNLNDAIKKYKQYIEFTSDSKNNSNSVTSQKNKSKNNNNFLNTPKDEDLILSFFNVDGENNEDNWENFVNNFSKENNVVTGFTLNTILTSFQTTGININLSKNIFDKNIGENINKSVNDNFSLETFKKSVDSNTFYKENFSPNTNVFLFDLRAQRVLLEDLIKDLEKELKSFRVLVEKEINEKLIENFKKSTDFNPNIKNSFRVIMDNTQAMIQTVYQVSKNSEEYNTKERFRVLDRYDVDIPKSIVTKLKSGEIKNGISFPSIYEKSSNDESSKEIYIGNVVGVTRDLFPEYDFVEKVFENIVNRREVLKQITKASNINSLDTDNWFPLNPMDYKVNPFIGFNTMNDEDEIKKSLYRTIISRVVLLSNYSNFTSPFLNEYSVYGKFDALNAKNIILNDNVKSIIEKSLKEFSTTKRFFIDNGLGDIFTDNLEFLVVKDGVLKIGDIPLTSNGDEGIYVDLDKDEVLSNSKKLWQSITDTDIYGNRNEKLEKTNSVYRSNNNITTNCLISSFINSVGKNITKKNSGSKNLYSLTYEIINPEEKYINVTNFKTTGTCKYEKYLVGSTFYNNQPNIYCRAYLALSTLPFNYFKIGVLDILNNEGGEGNNAKIIELPELYIYYIGSLLWRLKEDQIKFDITFSGCSYSKFYTPKDKYLSKFGSKTDETRSLEAKLLFLPESVKQFFINKFERWTKFSNFNEEKDGTFELLLKRITNENNIFNQDIVKESKSEITKKLQKISRLIIYNSNILDTVVNGNLFIDSQNLSQYVDGFLNVFNGFQTNQQSDENRVGETKKDKDNLDKLKLQLYNYFKNINDKWISDTEQGFNICGGQNKNLIDYFKFIDRGWNDIGDKASFDLKSFINLGTDLDVSVYFFISKILRDSNFLFQILPNYINYKNSDEVAQMFRPQTTLENNSSSGPIYCCIYAGGNSQALDIGERNNYYFSDDGFKFVNGVLPNDINSSEKANDEGEEDFSLVAFRVAFGSQNQSIFKSVSLNQQEHKETAEYFKVLSDTIDKRGATQRSYQGTNLIKLFKTRSYQCSVEALGCMNIQPLMYFDLQNVPFFNGAYLITNVTHQISPNSMSTSFNGLRQSKFVTPAIEDITTSLDLDLNESVDVPLIEFVNLTPRDEIYSIGVLSPNELFEFDTNFTVINFNNLGVTNITQEELNDFKLILKSNKIESNAQVCMFISNVLQQSDYLTNREYPWEFNTDSSTDPFEYVPNTTDPLYYDVITSTNNVLTPETGNIDKKYLNVQPIYSATTLEPKNDNISYNPVDTTKRLKQEKYLNIFNGDPYRFKPRGYLYVIGRKQYYDLLQNEGNEEIGDIYLKEPKLLSADKFQAMTTATKVWKNLKDNNNKSCFDYIKEGKDQSGSASFFTITVGISQQLNESKKIESSFIVFEKVLQNFTFENKPLINFFT